MDLASAYVLRPLNRLVLDFAVWNGGWVNERGSGDVGEDLRARGGVKDMKLIGDEVANGLGPGGGANLVDIKFGSTVHWRLAFITMGDYAGS